MFSYLCANLGKKELIRCVLSFENGEEREEFLDGIRALYE